jgi:hypothetical protein
MSDRDVTLRFNQEGADAVRTEVEAIRAALAQTPPTVEGVAEALRRLLAVEAQLVTQHRQLSTATTSLTSQWAAARTAFQQGQAAGTGLAGTLTAVGAAATGILTPLTLIGLGLGLAVGKMHEFNAAAVQTYRELRQLQSVSGLSFEDAGALKGAFARAGVSDQTLTFALNRLGVTAETDRASFERLGISIEGAGGRAKNSGELFLELHDKINQLTDANERANARRTFFGRAGSGELAPIFDQSREQLSGLIEKSREYANLAPDLVDRLKKLGEAQAELADRQREVKLAFAETITLPVEQWLTNVAKAAQDAGARIRAALRIAGPWGSLGAQFVDRQSAQDLLDSENQEKRIQATIRKGEADRKRDADERAATTAGTLSPDQARLAEAQVRIQSEQQQKLLQGEAAYRAELSRLREGNDVEAIQEQIRFTEETIRLAGERFTKLLDIERQRSPEGAVPTDVTTKLVKELADVTIAGQEQLKLLYVKVNQAMAASDQQRVSDAIRLERDSSEQRLSIIDNFAKQELAQVRTSAASEVAVTLETARIELDAAQKITAERLRQNALETQAVTALAGRKSALGINTRPEMLILADLAKQRVLMERDADAKIAESRASLVDKLDQLARREAQIGRQAVEAAAGALRDRRLAELAATHRREDFVEAQDEEREALRQRLNLGLIPGGIQESLNPEMRALTDRQNAARDRFERQEARDERRRQEREDATASSNQDLVNILNEKWATAVADFGRQQAGQPITDAQRANIQQMSDLRAQMAAAGTTAPGLAMMQQLQAGLMGLNEKLVPTALQGLDPVAGKFSTATDKFAMAVDRFAGSPGTSPAGPGVQAPAGTPGIASPAGSPGASGASFLDVIANSPLGLRRDSSGRPIDVRVVEGDPLAGFQGVGKPSARFVGSGAGTRDAVGGFDLTSTGPSRGEYSATFTKGDPNFADMRQEAMALGLTMEKYYERQEQLQSLANARQEATAARKEADDLAAQSSAAAVTSAWTKAREAAAAAWGGTNALSTPDTSGAAGLGRSATGSYGQWPAMPGYQSRFVPGLGDQPPTWAMTNTDFAEMAGERGFGNLSESAKIDPASLGLDGLKSAYANAFGEIKTTVEGAIGEIRASLTAGNQAIIADLAREIEQGLVVKLGYDASRQ